MTETTQPSAYPLHGTIAKTARRQDKRGQDFLIGTLTFRKLSGQEVTTTAMAFGKAVGEVEGIWSDGPISLYGTFKDGAFRVIGKTLPPRGEEQVADQAAAA